ncbi:MAG: YraN family protein [Hormoscilla sp. SP5CHS1]|nr:YraN family protein [Hormoscilla sp. SP12CHS1]MBC6453615.1 YraN family protein [Hormoscilla sp. SP5CHS1]
MSLSADKGVLGEELVAQWLQQQGWAILHRRWPTRTLREKSGELDIIAQRAHELAFVEVKTRSRRNWDGDGQLAIAAKKQQLIWQAAELFLPEHPAYADLSCRFDVALVRCHILPRAANYHPQESQSEPVKLGQAVRVGNYQFILQEYIPSAFDCS